MHARTIGDTGNMLAGAVAYSSTQRAASFYRRTNSPELSTSISDSRDFVKTQGTMPVVSTTATVPINAQRSFVPQPSKIIH